MGALGRHSHALTAEGHDASEDGTGRGTPIIVAPKLAATLAAGQAKPGVSAPGRRQEDDHNIVSYVAEIANALDTAQGGPDDNSAQAGHLVAYQKTQRSGARDADGNLPPEVWKQRDVSATLAPADLTSEHRTVELLTDGEAVVRRLTPLETCRLQGYPDGHTATSDGQPQADSAQYKQHSNGIAVPVFAWVAKRLAAVDGAAA